MQKLDIISAFEAYGHYLAADIDEEQMREVLRNACPGEGACGGMYTANTMASAIESLGMSLPYSSSYPASSEDKQQECLEAGAAIRNLLEIGPQAARHSDARGLRERHYRHNRHSAAPPTPCCI